MTVHEEHDIVILENIDCLVNQCLCKQTSWRGNMKEKTPREVHAEERREQIIEAATFVFSRKGFQAATNKEIAAEAGIAPGLIYHYFKDRQDLLADKGHQLQSDKLFSAGLGCSFTGHRAQMHHQFDGRDRALQ